MKRFLGVFLSVLMLFSLFGCSKSNDSILTQEAIKTIENSNSVDYGILFRNQALELMRYSDNDLGSCLAGSSADLDKANYIETLFTDLGLSNVHKENIIVDSWVFNGLTLSFECSCKEEGLLTLRKIGAYPCEFNYNNEKFDLVYVNKGLENDYMNIDVAGKGVLLNTSADLKKAVKLAKEKGASFIITSQESEYSITTYSYDMALNLPRDIPVFILSKSNFSLLREYSPENNIIEVYLTGSSEIEKNVEAPFVIGEIEGKKKDKYVYVTANRDSLEQGFMSSNLSIAELYLLAQDLKTSGFKPEYTIRFMITTGQEFSSISEYGYNLGLEKYLNTLTEEDKNNIQSVLVIDGSKPFQGLTLTETQISNNDALKEKIVEYNEKFKEKDYRFINTINEVNEIFNTEGLVWKEKEIPVVVQAEPSISEYRSINNSSSDNSGLLIDSTQSKFLYEYYFGIIKLMSTEKY